MEESIEHLVADALADVSGWAGIEDLNATVRARIELPTEFRRKAENNDLNKIIRRVMKKRVSSDGLAEWESLQQLDPDGKKVRVYKQIALFDKADYLRVIEQFKETTRYHARKANTLTVRCNQALGTRRQLPFPVFGLLREPEHQPASRFFTGALSHG